MKINCLNNHFISGIRYNYKNDTSKATVSYDCFKCRNDNIYYTVDFNDDNTVVGYYIVNKKYSLYSEIGNYTELKYLNVVKFCCKEFFEFDYLKPNESFKKIINKIDNLKLFI